MQAARVDPKEEHAMTQLKQPHVPVLAAAADKHLATFRAILRRSP